MFFSGMNGHGGGRPADTKLYDILKVSPNASDDEIKKSYKKLAREYHPDRNAEAGDKFKEISYAYEVLSDPRKKQVYDAHGMEGLEGGGAGGGFGGADLFSHLFGGDDGSPFGGSPFGNLFGHSGGGGSRSRRRKFPETVHPLRISLEDAYNGKTSKLQLTKRVVCTGCKSTGSASGKNYTCDKCKGRGRVMVVKQIGPGMIQQMQTACPNCQGEGSSKVPASDQCKQCKGERTITVQKVLEVQVQRGVQDGEKISFPNEGDQTEPDVEPGDVVIVIQIKEHEIFTRKGDDLFMTKELSLNEALCGYEFTINHLDGRTLLMKNRPGDIITPKSHRGIVSEGMPVQRHPEMKGNLIVQFDVRFPSPHFLNDDKKYKMLAKQFPTVKQPSPPAGADVEEVSLMEYDESRYARRAGGGRGGGATAHEEDEDSDEEGGPPGGVQCHQS